MALAFGGGVRPELGRTDYTPFLQGSVAGAQMQARGGESIGKALANLGQIAGKAIGEYQEKKQINQFVKQTSEDLFERVKNSPELFRLLGSPENAKAVEVGFTRVGGGDPVEGIKIFKQAQMKQEQEAMQQRRVSEAVSRYVGGDLEAAADIPENMLNAIINAQRFALEQRTGPEQPKLSFPEQQVQAEMEAFIAENGRPPRPDEMARIYQDLRAASRPVLTPEEETRREEMSMRNKAAFAANEAIIEGGAAARGSLRSIEQITSLLDDGLKTGFAGETLLKVKQLGKRLGIEGLETANAEQAQVLFGDFVMSRVQQTKGAISNKEMELFATFSPGLSKTPEGNRQILSFIKQADQRAQELSKMVRTWRANRDTETVIRAKIEDYQDENPLSIGAPSPTQAPTGVPQEAWDNMTKEQRALFQ